MAEDASKAFFSGGLSPNTTAGYGGSIRFYCYRCGHDQFEGCGCPPKVLKEKGVKMPELYSENLDTLKHIMARLDLFAKIEDVYEVEVRVRIDNVDTWAVIGYGESGDPCLLRFEPE